MKSEVFAHAINIKPKYFKDVGLLKIINDALYDVDELLNITESSFLTVFVLVFKTIGVCFGLYLLNWEMALYISLLIPIKFAINHIVSNKSFKYSHEMKKINLNYNKWFDDVVAGIFDIKLWNLYEKFSGQYQDFVSKTASCNMRRTILRQAHSNLTKSIEDIVLLCGYIIGFFFVSDLTVGGLISFISYAAFLYVPIDLLLNLKIIMRDLQPSIQGLDNFYSYEEELFFPEANHEYISIDTITFKDVSLILDKKIILNGICFTLQKGDKVAIVGDNGSGKSSIVNLLLRFVEPSSGAIYFNDLSIESLDIISYRKHISIVTQDIHLFCTSIQENIMITGDALNHCDIEDSSFLTKFINEMPEKFNTVIGVDGNKLSGGERQKIGLLRALHRKTNILIMDEPTSGYDHESEQKYIELIRNISDYDFTILISHGKEILKHVDVVITLDDGEIISFERRKAL